MLYYIHFDGARP